MARTRGSKEIAIIFVIMAFAATAKAQIDTVSLHFGSKMLVSSDILQEDIVAWLRMPSEFEEQKDSCSLLILFRCI